MSNQTRPSQSLADIQESRWKHLSSKRILFGHQSVGNNIISGIEELISAHKQITLNISQAEEAGSIQKPGFYHFGVGRNTDPRSKIDDFARRLRAGLGAHIDVAFFKLCYLDLDTGTDTRALFGHYQRALANLRREFPGITFAHVTVPLVAVQEGPKAWIKTFIGRPLYGIEDNYQRNEYNKLILETYGGKEPVFDLAKAESTYPDGTRSHLVSGGREIFVLAPEYTSDGGHLNHTGRRVVAGEFLRFLAIE
jgi:hypothetical protein